MSLKFNDNFKVQVCHLWTIFKNISPSLFFNKGIMFSFETPNTTIRSGQKRQDFAHFVVT